MLSRRKLGVFNLSISEISVTGHSDEEQLTSELNFMVGLNADDALGLNAEGYVSLIASSEVAGPNNNWRFERLVVRSLVHRAVHPTILFAGATGLVR